MPTLQPCADPPGSPNATETLRQTIAQLLNQCLPPAEIARRLGCSRPTVYKVRRLLQDPEANLRDGRRAGPRRPAPEASSSGTRQMILDMRTSHPSWGERRLYEELLKRAADRAQVPSPATIGRAIRAAGLAHKPIGPHDVRYYPDEFPHEHGTLTLDGWGPWHIRGTRLYLCTVQDRWSRLTAAIPASGGFGVDHRRGLRPAHWAAAILLATAAFEPDQRILRVYSDNGIGMVPSFGILPPAPRLALKLGARMIYIPPAQPWRNGRLERFHWTMEREFFREVRPTTVGDALRGLVEWLNEYNHERAHSQLKFQPPASRYPAAGRLTLESLQALPDDVGPQAGTVEAIRLVLSGGAVDLWAAQWMRVSPVLGGQYVRVQFDCPGPSVGRVLYERKWGEPALVVASFNHRLDAPGGTRRGPLVEGVQLVDFGAAPPTNQLLDMEQLSNQRGRVLRRRSSLEDQLQGEADSVR